jgi:putative transposase
MFLLRPDAATNNAFVYCLADAAARFEIDVLMTCAMSNHHHTVIFDRHGNYPQFLEHFHKLVARSQNALRGRWEHFWASGQTSVVRLVDRSDVISKLAYVATNPVKDHLVERAHQWPGVNTYAALRGQREVKARRPRHFFRAQGGMPAERTLKMTIPAELGSAEAFIEDLVIRVEHLELQAAEKRRAAGIKLVGRKHILSQRWKDSPQTFEPRRRLNPRVAATNVWSRIEALIRNRDFVNSYRESRRRWLAGLAVSFPPGTYWLRRFANVGPSYRQSADISSATTS